MVAAPVSTSSPPLWIFPPVHKLPQPQLSQYQPPSPSAQPVDAVPPLPSPQANFLSLPAPGLMPAPLIIQPTSVQPSSTVPLKEGFVDTEESTTFASWNPLKDIQPPRFQFCDSQTDAAKLGWAEMKIEEGRESRHLERRSWGNHQEPRRSNEGPCTRTRHDWEGHLNPR